MIYIKKALRHLARGETDLAHTCLSVAWNRFSDLEISHGMLRTTLEDIERLVPSPTVFGQKEQLLLQKKMAKDALDSLINSQKHREEDILVHVNPYPLVFVTVTFGGE